MSRDYTFTRDENGEILPEYTVTENGVEVNEFVIRHEDEFSGEKVQGHPYVLVRNGKKVAGGPWAECVEQAMILGKDEDWFQAGIPDTATTLGNFRKDRIDFARTVGIKIDDRGVMVRS